MKNQVFFVLGAWGASHNYGINHTYSLMQILGVVEQIRAWWSPVHIEIYKTFLFKDYNIQAHA